MTLGARTGVSTWLRNHFGLGDIGVAVSLVTLAATLALIVSIDGRADWTTAVVLLPVIVFLGLARFSPRLVSSTSYWRLQSAVRQGIAATLLVAVAFTFATAMNERCN